jgi:hypothetical protein
MHLLLKFWPVFLLLFFSCQDKKVDEKISSVNASYENNYFSLDFQNESLSMEDFSKHFFSNFPHNDPTRGEVIYDQSKWQNDALLELKEKEGLKAYIKARTDNKGFDSHRFSTKAYFNLNEENQRILFVYKGSMPRAEGLWPAWWLNGSRENEWLYQDKTPALNDSLLTRYSGIGNPWDTKSAVNNTDWPSAGEIDIIENINGDPEIYNTLHTCPQMCDSEWNEDGNIVNCANARPEGDVNKGCSGQTYSLDELSGTFACLWERKQIRFYHWPDTAEVTGKGGPLSMEPDPSLWTGKPLKNSVRLIETDAPCTDDLHQDWQCKSCSGYDHCTFKNMKMIFNMTTCGIWAGTHFDETDQAWDNCRDYILNEGKDAIDGQYMKIEYVAVKKI